ncbi:MAG TPA: response regulator transcription factor [Burkholderiaceae bacterium]|jgi:DNA-binding NarL/FixJ family response regulator|nr:response regulator transcription factor [Burkholderiaceae bacterium]
MTRPRVLLADDHRIVAAGLQALLSADYELVGHAQDGRSLLELARQQRADFIVADISMPGLNGIDALRAMRREGLDVPVIFLTMHTEPAYARRALEAGAAGYVLKHAAPQELLHALHVAAQGGVYISREIAAEVLAAPGQRPERDPASGLTPRQREIIALLVEGRSAKEIARLLDISHRTVEYHKYQAMEALGVASNAELIQLAIRLRIAGP